MQYGLRGCSLSTDKCNESRSVFNFIVLGDFNTDKLIAEQHRAE